MSNPSFDQAYQLLNIIRESGKSLEELQALYATGLLSDLLKITNPEGVNREDFGRVLGHRFSGYRIRMTESATTDELVGYLRSEGFQCDDEITQANFPIREPNARTRDENLEILDPGHFSVSEALELLRKNGLVAPTYEHAIRFARQYGTVTYGSNQPYVVFPHRPWLGPKSERYILMVQRGVPDGRRSLRLHRLEMNTKFIETCMLAGVRPTKRR